MLIKHATKETYFTCFDFRGMPVFGPKSRAKNMTDDEAAQIVGSLTAYHKLDVVRVMEYTPQITLADLARAMRNSPYTSAMHQLAADLHRHMEPSIWQQFDKDRRP